MPRLRLRTIAEPTGEDTRRVFVRTGGGNETPQPSDERIVLMCGRCESPLLVNVSPELLANVVLKCPQCESFNETES